MVLLIMTNDLLRELDYTVCSIHSRFSFGKQQQTDNRYFDILGHATGRLLLKRPGYELDSSESSRKQSKTAASLK